MRLCHEEQLYPPRFPVPTVLFYFSGYLERLRDELPM